MAHQLDPTDYKIIRLLHEDASRPHHELAKKAHMAPSTFSRRVQWLEKQGIIKKYVCIVDPAVMGYTTLGYTLIRLTNAGKKKTDAIVERLKREPGVAEICKILGEKDLIVKLYARDNKSYQELLETLDGGDNGEEFQTTTLLATQVAYDEGLPGVISKTEAAKPEK